VDDSDPMLDVYKTKFSQYLRIFSKADIASRYDSFSNLPPNELKSSWAARCAVGEIAKSDGHEYFWVLDDDYLCFRIRYDLTQWPDKYKYLTGTPVLTGGIDKVLRAMAKMLDSDERILSVALAQGGDFIGGKNSSLGSKIYLKRKAMNSFLCRTDRLFPYYAFINDDVNTYIIHQTRGKIFFTIPIVDIDQSDTQSLAGGMTDLYKKYGTYSKSFYSVVAAPAAVKIWELPTKNRRIHHKINWNRVAPKILREGVKLGVRNA